MHIATLTDTHILRIPDTSVLHDSLNGQPCRVQGEAGYLNGPDCMWVMIIVNVSVIAVPAHWAIVSEVG